MGVINRFSHSVDRVNHCIGAASSWLIPAMALVTFTIVILRYGFSVGAIAAQELVLYLHSAAFLFGASFTLLGNQHVRVDVFYRHFSVRQRAWVNAIGHVLFTLPVCALIALGSQQYVADAWRILESSPEPGGIPAVFLLKTMIPTMAVLLALQAVSETIKSLTTLCKVDIVVAGND